MPKVLNKKVLLIFIFAYLSFLSIRAMEDREKTLHFFKDTDEVTIKFTNNVTKTNHRNFEQEKEYDTSMYKTEDTITYQIMHESKVPYKTIKTCPVLCSNISTENNTVTIPVTDISIKTLTCVLDFLKIYPNEQLEDDLKYRTLDKSIKLSEQKLFEVFDVRKENNDILQAIKNLYSKRAQLDHACLHDFKNPNDQLKNNLRKTRKFMQKNEERLFELLHAANYLNCKPLYAAACHAMLKKLEHLIFAKNNLNIALKLLEQIEQTDHYEKIFKYACVNVKYRREIAVAKSKKTFEGHSKIVNFLSFSPDDKTLASGSYDNSIKLWDITTGKCIRTIEGVNINFGHDGELYSNNGTKFASIFGGTPTSITISTLHDLSNEFTLSTLLFLEYLIHQKEQGTLQQVPHDWDYLYLYGNLPETFQEQFKEIFDYNKLAKELKENLEKKD